MICANRFARTALRITRAKTHCLRTLRSLEFGHLRCAGALRGLETHTISRRRFQHQLRNLCRREFKGQQNRGNRTSMLIRLPLPQCFCPRRRKLRPWSEKNSDQNSDHPRLCIYWGKEKLRPWSEFLGRENSDHGLSFGCFWGRGRRGGSHWWWINLVCYAYTGTGLILWELLPYLSLMFWEEPYMDQ